MTCRHPVAHVPASIDFDRVTEPELRDYARWMVHLVARRRFTHHLEPDAWVPLTFDFQRRFIPDRRAASVMRDLVAAEALEVRQTCQFFPGRRKGVAYQYRIAAAHRQSRLVAVEIHTPKLLANIHQYRTDAFRAVTDPVHLALRGYAWEAVTVVEGAPEHPVLDAIRQGEPWFVVCDQGRVHTAMTTLARDMRSWVRLGGSNDLVAVDVSHSQPLLLAVTLGREGLTDEAFLTDCLAGHVYCRFASALNVTRDEAKERLFGLLYGAPDRYDRRRSGRRQSAQAPRRA